MRISLLFAVTPLLAAPLLAQTAAPAAAPRPAPVVPPAAQQIAAAVQPLPESLRAGARVWGYSPDARFTELQPGTGSMTCIADDPKDDRFHVACYANTMEPFMARGRELRAQGRDELAVDSLRKADVRDGRIRMPSAAMLYSLTGRAGSYDPATNRVTGATPLVVVYVPFATGPSLGLPNRAPRGQPWIMHGGEAGAHIMIVGSM